MINRYIFAALFAGFVIANSSLSAVAGEDHGQEAVQHLEQASESAKKGATEEAAEHAEEAKKHVIEQNKERPYQTSPKKISGENLKQQHDEEAFSNMAKAKGHAKKGHAKEAAESAGKAEEHLKEKGQSK